MRRRGDAVKIPCFGRERRDAIVLIRFPCSGLERTRGAQGKRKYMETEVPGCISAFMG